MAPIRPTNPLTYEQMVAYEANRIKWFKFYGYVTNLKELADIFELPHGTFITRLKAGWPIEAALLADTKTQWTIKNINFFVNYQMDTAAIYDKLESKFPSAPIKSNSKIKRNRVIDGGHYD